MTTANVLGLDGSLQNFGIAVGVIDYDTNKLLSVTELVLSKTIKSSDKHVKRADDDFQRFSQHIGVVRNLASKYHVEYIFGEIPSGAQDARAAFAFGGVTAILAGFSHDYETITVTPQQVKLAATGIKHADKEDVILRMHDLFPDANWITSKRPNAMNIQGDGGLWLTNANEHLADSIACVLAGLKKL